MLIKTKREVNTEILNGLYNNFIKIVEYKKAKTVQKELGITEYKYYVLLKRWTDEKIRIEKVVKKEKEYKRQNKQDGYSDWVSKILRVS